MPIISGDAALRDVFEQVRTIAVLGATRNPVRAGYYVPAYLQQQGYEILPVNPAYVGQEILGQPVVDHLGALDGVDMVDVFRRSEFLADHLPELLALKPKVVWFQLGVFDDAVSTALSEAGILVVENRCALADHRRLGVGRR